MDTRTQIGPDVRVLWGLKYQGKPGGSSILLYLGRN